MSLSLAYRTCSLNVCRGNEWENRFLATLIQASQSNELGCQWMAFEVGRCLLKFTAELELGFQKTQAKYISGDSGLAKEVPVQEAVFLLLY